MSYVISGNVTVNGVPFANATVICYDPSIEVVVDTTATDVNGDYVFTSLSPKTYHIIADVDSSYDVQVQGYITPESDGLSTTMLLHFDGSDGSTVFTDEKEHTITPYGNAEISTVQSKFGGSSGYFDESSYLDVTSSPDFDFGSSDFTVEGWFYFLSNTKGFQFLIDRRGSVDQTGWVLFLDGDNGLRFLSASSGAWNVDFDTTYIPPINTWTHIAMVRNGNAWSLYANGTMIMSGTTTNSIGTVTANMTIGKSHIGSESYLYGYIDEIRISNGVARWTENFTPPTAPYVVD